MAEHNNHVPAHAEKGEHQEAQGNRNHRSRHRQHRRGNHRPRPENAEREATTAAEQAPAAPAENNRQKNNHNNRSQQKKNGKQNDQQNDRQSHSNKGGQNGGKNHSHKGGRGSRHGAEKRPYDPYEAPSKEEIALSELRAKIVMQAADGSVPTAYGATVEKPTESASEPLPTAEELENALPPLASAADPNAAAKANVKKVEVVGIRFRSAGKMYYFDPRDIKLKKGDYAVVETTRGPEFGDVCLGNSMINETSVVSPLRPVIRLATPADVEMNAQNREKEGDALKICQEKIRAHKLEMKLIDAQYAFDGSKILFYFSADGRVDFRELVKDLASVFRTRIELRQIGIRDEAKLLGGIGACGRPLCCASFLPDFAQVSIKMAKDQNLSLNSSKISGVCGRLMCCLRYEEDVYLDEIRKTPSNDSTVQTPDGVGTVISSNPLAGTVRVILKDQPDTPPKQYSRNDLTVLPKEKKSAQNHENRAEKSTKSN